MPKTPHVASASGRDPPCCEISCGCSSSAVWSPGGLLLFRNFSILRGGRQLAFRGKETLWYQCHSQWLFESGWLKWCVSFVENISWFLFLFYFPLFTLSFCSPPSKHWGVGTPTLWNTVTENSLMTSISFSPLNLHLTVGVIKLQFIRFMHGRHENSAPWLSCVYVSLAVWSQVLASWRALNQTDKCNDYKYWYFSLLWAFMNGDRCRAQLTNAFY